MAPGQVFTGKGVPVRVNKKTYQIYCKGIDKLIYLEKHSIPKILNAFRKVSRFDSNPNEAHYKTILCCLKYCVDTKDQRFVICPERQWDGKDRKFLF